MATYTAIVSSVADLMLQRADVYMAQDVIPTDSGATQRGYSTTPDFTSVPCQIFWSGGKQFGATPQYDFGLRVVVSPVVGLFLLDAPIRERDRIVVDGAPYNIHFIRIEYDNLGPSHLLVALERAATEPFMDGTAI